MSRNEILEIVKENVIEVLPDLEEHIFKDDDKLVELGANSIDRAEIVMMTMESLSLQIPRVELSGVKNIGELVDAFYTKLNEN